MGSHTFRQPTGATEALRIGDVLREAVYRRSRGAAAPVLLLAAGQRIETEVQLRQLRAEGFTVALPGEGPPPGVLGAAGARSTAGTGRAGPGRATGMNPGELPADIAERLEAAARVRQVVIGATRDLMGRIRSGAALEIDLLHQAAAALLSELAGNGGALTTLSYLHPCDDYTVEHSADVAILMVAIARVQSVPEPELPVVALAGLMHDAGKQRVPVEILSRPGRLTAEEFAEIKKHPQHGFDLLAACAGCPEPVRLVALQHHERLDGSGYPGQLTGDQLHPYSRIAAVADAFDAMTSNRVYHRGCPPRAALLELYRDRQRRMDPEAVDGLIRVVGVYPVGTRVRLNTGERGVVIAPNPRDSTLPIVRIERDWRGGALAVPRTVALDGKARRVAGPDESP